LGYININSIRNKHDGLKSILGDSLDVFSVAESKLDNSFPSAQFSIKGYKYPVRLDINGSSGGILIYIRNGIPSRYLVDLKLPEVISIVSQIVPSY